MGRLVTGEGARDEGAPEEGAPEFPIFLFDCCPPPPTVGERHFVLGIASSVNVGGDRCTVDIGM